jgi:hypothetical protein
MPEQLPVIPLATLLAHSKYVKQSQYTPRQRKKRTHGAGSTMHASQKQPAETQQASAPVPLPGGSHPGGPGGTPPPQPPQFAPTRLVPLSGQRNLAPVDKDVQIEQWQQEKEAGWQSGSIPPNWPPVPPQQPPYGWYPPPPPWLPPWYWYSASPPPWFWYLVSPPPPPAAKPVEWPALVLVLICLLFLVFLIGCLSGLIF